MRSFPACCCLVLLAGAALHIHAARLSADETPRPNFVFLMSDDQCTNSLGCYGADGVKTPHIDSLARDGVVFDNHYDTTAICMASRANVMTGMYEYKTGCNFEHGALLDQHWQKSYPVLLRKAGYLTAMAGKIGFEVADKPHTRGHLPSSDFDAWGGGPGQTSYATAKNRSMAKYAKEFPHSTLAYGAFGRDFIASAAGSGKPFCLSISFKAPHHPTTADPRFKHVYAGATFKKPANYGRGAGSHFSKQSQSGRQYERFFSWDYANNYDKVMATYYQQIYAIDVATGMIRRALKEHKVASNTVVIYTSDNGFLCGAHGYASKVLPYEEASRVPLIVYDPRHPSSGKKLRSRALTGNVDFAPTMLEMAGLPVPANIDGKSLLPLLDNPAAATHKSLPLINVWGPAPAQSLSIVTQDWKYIFWSYGGNGYTPTGELYHTAEDTLEMKNLINDPGAAARRREMEKLYDQTLAHWKQQGVSYHKYSHYTVVFDRKTPWAQKELPARKQPVPARKRARNNRKNKAAQQ